MAVGEFFLQEVGNCHLNTLFDFLNIFFISLLGDKTNFHNFSLILHKICMGFSPSKRVNDHTF